MELTQMINGIDHSEVEVLPAVRQMSPEQLELERLRRENAELKAKAAQKSNKAIHCKVSEKGALSVYGLGRFPVTLYKSQWLRLIDFVENIKAFIKANDKALKEKE